MIAIILLLGIFTTKIVELAIKMHQLYRIHTMRQQAMIRARRRVNHPRFQRQQTLREFMQARNNNNTRQ